MTTLVGRGIAVAVLLLDAADELIAARLGTRSIRRRLKDWADRAREAYRLALYGEVHDAEIVREEIE